MRGFSRCWWGALCVCVCLGCSCAVAQAAVTHAFVRQVPGFERPNGLAVGPVGAEAVATETSAVFVADSDVLVRVGATGGALPFECKTTGCEAYVEGDELKGTPEGVFGVAASVAIDDATGEIFVSTGTAVDVFKSTGEYLGRVTEVPVLPGATINGPFDDAAGLAFDQQSGDLYIAVEGAPLSSEDVVDVFKREGPGTLDFQSQFGSGVISAAGGLEQTVAVVEEGLVEAGSVYVTDPENDVVDVFDAVGSVAGAAWTGAGTPSGSFGTNDLSVGLDPVDGRVFVADNDDNVVDEFEASVSEEYLGRLTGTPTGGEGAPVRFTGPTAVAVDRHTGGVDVGDYRPEAGTGVVDECGPDLKIPEVKAEVASERSTTSVRLNGVVTLAGEHASCRFAWGATTGLGSFAACEPEAVVGETGEVAVHATLRGLTAGTTYFYKLYATNTENHQENTGESEALVSFRTVGPNFGAVSVSDVASGSVELHALVDPDGAPTSVSFEYGRCVSVSVCASAGYEASTPPQAVGAGAALVSVEAHVQGLTPGVAYHFRVLASSETALGRTEGFPGPSGVFSTQTTGAFGLLDGREWEMVSPPGKDGALLEGPGEPWGVAQAAADGGAMTYLANVPTESGLVGYSNAQQVLSRRSASGWSSVDLSSPHNGAVSGSVNAGEEYRFFAEDLSVGIVQPFGAFEPCVNSEGVAEPCFSVDASEQTAFSRSFESGLYTPLVTGCPVAGVSCGAGVRGHANVPEGTVFGQQGIKEGRACPPEKFCGPFFVGASPDARHVVLRSYVQLTGEAAAKGGLYEWSAEKPAGEQLQLVSVLPGSEGAASHPSFGTSTNEGSGAGEDARNAISSDGSRVFWTSNTGTLYMRDTMTGKTLQIAADVGFQVASSTGGRVFYSEHGDLYECEIPEALGCKPVLLGEAPAGGGSVIGASEDGSFVYWVAASRVLYVDQLVGGVWQRKQIAVLSSEDRDDWASNSASLLKLTGRVSPDGEWLAFMSDRSLTGYDNLDAVSGRPDEETYLYSAESGGLTCASCEPTGGRPTGVEYADEEARNLALVGGGGYEGWEYATWLSGWLPGWTAFESVNGGVARVQPRYLSDSGRLFFDSDDGLVADDINGTWDVYEFEPVGVGSCGSGSGSGSVVFRAAVGFDVEGVAGEEAAGCVGLVSSGESARESVFLDASESGGDVFFLTAARLAPQDFDDAYDVYDAHECTGVSPCTPQVVSAAGVCVTAEACRAAPAPQPSIFGAPSSATFNGAGNVAPVPVVQAVAQTRAEKLAGALRACRRDRRAKKRVACEKGAREKYRAKAKSEGKKKAKSEAEKRAGKSSGGRG
jgi:hypothetical protein